MMNINLQQVIYLISVLNAKYDKLANEVAYEYLFPLKINDEVLDNQEKEAQMQEAILALDVIEKDILTLKKALGDANHALREDNSSLYLLLEEVKLKRNLLARMENALTGHRKEVVSGVGVITYGVLNENLIRIKLDALEKEVNSLSEKIDRINSTTFIEVALIGEY